MPLVNVSIHGRNYEMHCDEGQEAHLKALADTLSGQETALAQQNPAADEARLLVMAGLLLSDEYLAEKASHEQTSQRLVDARAAIERDTKGAGDRMAQATNYVADALDDVSARLERLALSLEQSSEEV